MNVGYLVLAAAFLLLFGLERVRPLRTAKRRLAPRLVVNAVISAIAIGIALLVVRPLALGVLQWTSDHNAGLTNMLGMPPAIEAVLCFLLLDLSFYYWHRVNHTWPWLWRFHNAHHVDPDLDISTAMRFHGVEIVYSSAFRALQVLVIGGPAEVLIAYEFCFQLNTFFQHSNVRFPIRAERWLNLIIVTPRMHGIHHSMRFDETNANWSTVFSFWDRLHGTLNLNVPQARIDIGIAGYAEPRDNTVGAILAMPFRRQRDYWMGGNRQEMPDSERAAFRSRLAE
jgi:sterol desaturase/sphingolipid hydroxylase (fatty acid hydroxylase superfamily)